MPLPLIIAAVAAGIQVYGQISQGNAQAAASQEADRMRQIEAQEIRNRLNINRDEIFGQGELFKVGQSGSIAASGRLSNDSTLSLLENTNAQVSKKIRAAEMEANFNAGQLIFEGQMARSKGEDLQKAGYINAGSTLLTSAYNISQYSTSRPTSNPNNSPYSLSTWDLNTTNIGQFRNGYK